MYLHNSSDCSFFPTLLITSSMLSGVTENTVKCRCLRPRSYGLWCHVVLLPSPGKVNRGFVSCYETCSSLGFILVCVLLQLMHM